MYAVWATGFFFYTLNAFIQQFDDALAEEVATLVELTELDEARSRRTGRTPRIRFELEFGNLADPESDLSLEARYFQLWTATGRVLARSASLGDAELERPADARTTPSFRDLTLPNGERGRAASLRFTPRLDRDLASRGFQPTSDHVLQIVVARPRGSLDDTRALLIQGFLAFGCLLPIGTIWVVRQAVRRGLMPLNRMANDLTGIDASTLTARFPSRSAPEEMQPVVARLNDLFARLETAFQRERRLTADIAHELRTPIAELRMLAEMRLQTPSDPVGPAVRRDHQEVLDIAMQMEHQVSSLLALARCDANAVRITPADVDLNALIERTWRPHRRLANRRHVTAHFELADRVTVRSDPHLLAAVLDNLFSNAAAYATRGGTIQCEVRRQADLISFRLANTSDQLGPHDLEHLFEPFWRKDAARSDSAHAGLGLALVKSYVTLLRLNLQASLDAPGLFTVTFSTPSAGQA